MDRLAALPAGGPRPTRTNAPAGAPRRAEAGFTIIELVISMALLAMAINSLGYTAQSFTGSQAESDATYTIGACSASYHGLLLTPIATCGSDADCNPFADPAIGRAAGSGVNPFYPVSCNMEVGALYGEDPGTGICWFTGNTFPQVTN